MKYMRHRLTPAMGAIRLYPAATIVKGSVIAVALAPLLLHSTLCMYYVYRIIGKLPSACVQALSTLLFWLVYHVARYRRTVVAENLLHAFPEKSAVERRALAVNFYKHLCNFLLEMLQSRALSLTELQRRVRLVNPEVLTPLVAQKQPILFLTAHQGNWEWLLHVLSDRLDCPIDVVYKPLHSAAMDRYMREARARSGNPIPFKDAGREILRRHADFRCFAMLADQSPFKRDNRYWHNFLNRPASFYLGPQRIAEVGKFPVVYTAIKKVGRGLYETTFEVIGQPPYPRKSHVILDRYIDSLEVAIRSQPETWLWSNRKWKHIPGIQSNGNETSDTRLPN